MHTSESTTTEAQFGMFTAPEGPMQFICMDIVGSISPVSSGDNKFCLTVVDMLTGYTMAIAISNKSAEMLIKAYMDHVYSMFGGSSCMLTDNGNEFRNDIFDKVCNKLRNKESLQPSVHTTVQW